MAYTIKQLRDVTWEEINKMSKRELYSRLNRMDTIISKRIANFASFRKGKGISDSPALRIYKDAGGEHLAYTHLTKSKYNKTTRQKMLSEYMRGYYFLNSESSTATAWYKIQSRTLKSIEKIAHVKVKHKDFDRFWDIVGRLMEKDPSLRLPENKYEAFRQAARMLAEDYSWAGSSDDGGIVDAIIDEMTRLYEQNQANRMDELSGMFKLTKKTSASDKKRKTTKSKKHKAGELDVDTGDLDVDIDIDDIL